ncbi:MAG TPA: hypothetical protein VFB19_01795 [Mycobacterium sp.]|nr:hypothetical protein [Mycobacterium sp.]
MLKLPLIGVGAVLVGVAVALPAHADPPIYPPSYGSSGTFAVGTQARDGATAFIPPGRYNVEEAPGPFKAPGFWLRCRGIPCTPTHPENIIATGNGRDVPTVQILPSDTAVYLFNQTLTFAG